MAGRLAAADGIAGAHLASAPGEARHRVEDLAGRHVDAARAHLAVSFSDSSQRVLPPLDSETRARLRELGYVE